MNAKPVFSRLSYLKYMQAQVPTAGTCSSLLMVRSEPDAPSPCG